MKALVKSVLDNFPKLSFCDVIERFDTEDRSAVLKPLMENTGIQFWVNWFYKNTDTFDLLRIKLQDQADLIFSRTDKNHYLIILNQHENITILLNFLEQLDFRRLSDPVVKTLDEKKAFVPFEPQQLSELDAKMKDAMRIQKMIMPKDVIIRKKFKKFFAVHEQQDMVGGDFYWYQETPNGALVSLIDCTGHSVEGAMASMVCNSLLNQAYASFDPSDVSDFVSDFYDKFNAYNDEANEVLNYGIGAEMALFYFDYEHKEVKIASTGISAFLKKKDGVELLKARKIIDYSKVREVIEQTVISMEDISGIYAFTDGLTDQFDSNDRKKLGYKGVRKMIESESDFGAEYYSEELNKWMGENMQYDDITLLGLAI